MTTLKALRQDIVSTFLVSHDMMAAPDQTITKDPMKKIPLLTAILMLSFSLQAKEVAGIHVPDSIIVTQHTLQLNGAGPRSKIFMDLYVASLYTSSPANSLTDAMSSEAPVALQLDITSSLVTAEKLIESLKNGFVTTTNNNLDHLQERLDTFINAFTGEVKKGDQFLMIKHPGNGMDAFKNGQQIVSIEGDDFAEPFFSIWLGDYPVDNRLKKAMLGL